jgi:hypothetical protein
LFLAAALILPMGCGLSDYEAKLAAAQKYAERVDEENEHLGDPLELPPSKEQSSAMPGQTGLDIFFRPPKGIAATPEKTAPLGELLYRYPRKPAQQPRYSNPAFAVPSGALENPDSPFVEVDFAVAQGGDWNDFVQKIYQPFKALQRPEQKSEAVKVTKEPRGRPRLEFQTLTFEDPQSTYQVYFHQAHTTHVAIVYRVLREKAQTEVTKKEIDLSLQSLAVGPEASTQRSRYRPRS